MSTINAIAPTATNPTTQNFAVGTITPPTLPPVSDTAANIHSALMDQLAGAMISLFQHLFLVSEDPNYRTLPFTFVAGTDQLNAVRTDLNNILAIVIAVNQITNDPANRIPAGSSINTNPPYEFIDGTQNTVINAINQMANDIIYAGSITSAQLNYTTLRDLLNPIFNY